MTPSALSIRSVLGAGGRRLAFGAFLAAAAGAVFAGPAEAAKRLALVIGNGAYESVTKLPNARNDADATAQMLADAHFDVRRAMDASLPNLRAAVERFAERSRAPAAAPSPSSTMPVTPSSATATTTSCRST